MKKIFIYSTFILILFSCSKEKSITDYTNNQELISAKQTIKPEQQKEFYRQFAKNKMVEDMKSKFTYKNYPEEVLRKFADTILQYNNSNNEELNVSENNKIIKQLDILLVNKSNTDKFSRNLELLLGKYPIISKENDKDEHSAFEEVPTEIFKILYWGGGKVTEEFYYKVNGLGLETLNIIPDDQNFYSKFNKFERVNFQDNEGRTHTEIKKSDDGNYLIKAAIFLPMLDDNGEYLMQYDLEYNTKDFKTFIPVRIKSIDDNAKWLQIE